MALRYGFEGVELRTIQNTINLWELRTLPRRPWPLHAANSSRPGWRFLVVGTSVSFAKPDPGNKERQLDLVRKFSAIAKGLDCPYLHVFGGPIPDGQTYSEVLNRDIEGLW